MINNNNKINNIFEYLKENIINFSSIYKNEKVINSGILTEHFYFQKINVNNWGNFIELKDKIKSLT
jgi:hypothetical protein